jgi:hypothetical protein
VQKIKTLFLSLILITAIVLAAPSISAFARPLSATSPTLGAAASYSVLGGQTVTNTGNTTMPGDLGVSPGSAVTGFPPGVVGPPGSIHAADANAAAAQSANTAAFGFIDQGCETTYTGTQDLVGLNLVPGVYCADAFTLSGTLTLSGSGVWIFKSSSDLVTSGSANVLGGDPCNVWWRVVSSATLGTNTSLIGNILASTSISLQNGASLNGRALAQTGQVSLANNTITGSSCLAAPAATNTPTATVTATATATVTTTPGPDVVTATPTVTPTVTTTPGPGTTTAVPPTATNVPKAATNTPVNSISGLPNTGGAPIRNTDFPWSLVIVSGFTTLTLALGIQAYRRSRLPK